MSTTKVHISTLLLTPDLQIAVPVAEEMVVYMSTPFKTGRPDLKSVNMLRPDSRSTDFKHDYI